MLLVSIPSQAGTLFGPGRGRVVHRGMGGLNTLSGGHPLRTHRWDLCGGPQRGLNTLSGGHPLRTSTSQKRDSSSFRLNTLSGGHPLRTLQRRGLFDLPVPVSIPSQAGTLFGPTVRALTAGSLIVSIPSQAGTLFGPDWWVSGEEENRSLNTLSGGHPLRTWWSPTSLPGWVGLNTLSGGHPLRTVACGNDRGVCGGLNTLSGGHPLRTISTVSGILFLLVSIPSQAGTLFGRQCR